MEADEQLDDLLAELNLWRRKSLARLKTQRVHLPRLFALTGHDRSMRPAQQLDAVRHFMTEAVSATAVRSPVSADVLEGSCSPGAMMEVFGLTRASMDASVEHRQELAGHVIDRGKHTVRKDIQAQLEQMATWLHELHDAIAGVDSGDELKASPLIGRDREMQWLRRRFRTLTKGGGQVLLWGISGSGRTALAEAFADEVGPSQCVAFVRVGSPGLFEKDLRRALQLEGRDTNAMNDAEALSEFRRAIQQPRQLRLLVLDDLSDVKQVQGLLPSGSQIPVLLISRLNLASVRAKGWNLSKERALHIGPLGDLAGAEMLKRRLPEVDTDRCEGLSRLIGGHPGFLVLVADYLSSENTIGADNLFDDLLNRNHDTVRDLAVEVGTDAVVEVLSERILEDLSESKTARELLEILAWIGDDGKLSREVVTDLLGELRGEKPSALDVTASLSGLERHGILRVAEENIVIPPLVATAFQSLSVSKAEAILLAYERLLDRRDDPSLVPTPVAALQADRQASWVTQLWAHLLMGTNFFVLSVMRTSMATWEEDGRRRATIYRAGAPWHQRLDPHTLTWHRVSMDDAIKLTRLAYWYVDDAIADDPAVRPYWHDIFGDPPYGSSREDLISLGARQNDQSPEAVAKRARIAEFLQNAPRNVGDASEEVEILVQYLA